MGSLPKLVEDVLDAALVSELSVLDEQGVPITYPLIPLYDGERVYMTSSVLFSRKLDHIKSNPRVSMTVTDKSATDVENFARITIQGDAQILDEDLHSGWEGVLPLWEAKEPIISDLVKKRFAMPLFWERAVIEIKPRRILMWAEGKTDRAPEIFEMDPVA